MMIAADIYNKRCPFGLAGNAIRTDVLAVGTMKKCISVFKNDVNPDYKADSPPSTDSICPVMKELPGEAAKRMASTTSEI